MPASRVAISAKRGVTISAFAAAQPQLNQTSTSSPARASSSSLTASATSLERAAHDAALNIEMSESISNTVATTQELRPNKTVNTYTVYQKRFADWARTKKFADGETVTGDKLMQEVIDKASRKNAGRVLGLNTMKTAINAVISLHNSQVSLQMNANAHPRTNAVMLLTRNVQKQRVIEKRTTYVDKGKGSLLEGYADGSDFLRLCEYWFGVDDLMMRCCFLVSQFCLLRGDNVRSIDLSEIFTQDLGCEEGFTPCIAIVFLVDHGKCNQYGKLMHVGMLRHKEAVKCPVNALALYLFERFHISNEPFPSFGTNADWFDIKLLRGRDKTRSITYETHRRAYAQAFDQMGMIFNKVTHLNRNEGRKELERHCVDSSQTKRHGLWGTDTCDGVYGSPIAVEAMRAFSGHAPKEKVYYLKRAVLVPDADLQKMVFPEVDEILRKVQAGNEGLEQQLAAIGFLKMLQYLREVIIQDACILMDLYPSLKVWRHEIFRSPAFIDFKMRLANTMQTAQDPTINRIERAIPELAPHIFAMSQSIHQKLDNLSQQVDRAARRTETQVASILSHGRFELSFRP